MNSTMVAASGRFGHLVNQPVIVTFSDGHQDAGILAKVGWDLIEVDHANANELWGGTYSTTGDIDTAHVVSVVLDEPQREALF